MRLRRNIAIAIALAACVAASPAARGQGAQGLKGQEKFVPLFDGKALDGWIARGGEATYKAEGGMIVGTTVEGSRNTFLCTTKEYGDFELVLEVKCDPELNSGIQIRSHVYRKDTPQVSRPGRIRKAGEVYGYQCEITRRDRGNSGNFWDEARRTRWLDDFTDKPQARQAFKEGQWNRYRIVAQGHRIRSWVNGVRCADFRDSEDATGFIGLQVHSIRRGTGPYQVRWRNIKIRELKPGEEVTTGPRQRRESPRGRVNRRFDEASPQIGELLPDVTAYDAEGNEFKLRSLKGHYTVLVFGCLT